MTTLTTLSVTGMTCEHCVSAVTRELNAVDGVKRVTVELRNGGTSSISVHSAAPLEEAALRGAIDEAGYDVVGLNVLEDALAAQMTSRADQYRATGVREETGHGHAHGAGGCGGHGEAAAEQGAAGSTDTPPAESKAHGGCACGCGGQGRQGLGIGLPIVPLN